jgi:uncharacterized membrane protein
MQTKPKIQIKLWKLDKSLELLNTIVLVAMFCLAVFVYLKSPDIIPSHFNASGKPDGYSDKSVVFILLFIGIVTYFGFNQLVKFPHVFNYPVSITEDNAERQYELVIRRVRFLQLAILIIFTVIILMTYLTNIGISDGLGTWFLPFALCIGIVPVIITLIQSFKTKF